MRGINSVGAAARRPSLFAIAHSEFVAHLVFVDVFIETQFKSLYDIAQTIPQKISRPKNSIAIYEAISLID